MKAAIVIHYDLERIDGWVDKSDIDNNLSPMVSIGFVTGENDRYLTLSMAETEEEVLFTFTIPKSAILKISTVELPDLSDL